MSADNQRARPTVEHTDRRLTAKTFYLYFPGDPFSMAEVKSCNTVPATEGGTHADNARRLAACWNACQGISTEALEAGAIAECIEALHGGRGAERGGLACNLAWSAKQVGGTPMTSNSCRAIIVDILAKYAATIRAALGKLEGKSNG